MRVALLIFLAINFARRSYSLFKEQQDTAACVADLLLIAFSLSAMWWVYSVEVTA